MLNIKYILKHTYIYYFVLVPSKLNDRKTEGNVKVHRSAGKRGKGFFFVPPLINFTIQMN